MYNLSSVDRFHTSLYNSVAHIMSDKSKYNSDANDCVPNYGDMANQFHLLIQGIGLLGGKTMLYPIKYKNNGKSVQIKKKHADEIDESFLHKISSLLNDKGVSSLENFFKRFNKESIRELAFKSNNIQDISCMFNGCKSIREVVIDKLFDVPEVRFMSYMFCNCENLSRVVIDMKIKKVEKINGMFYGCTKLGSLKLSSIDTKNVYDMSYMFHNCSNLGTLDISILNTSSVQNMGYMFSGCKKLVAVDLSGFDTSKVTHMGYMFYKCYCLKEINLSSFDTSLVVNMSSMFNSCKSLGEITFGERFDTSNVKYYNRMFFYCKKLKKIDISAFNTSNYIEADSVFVGCDELEYITYDGLDIPIGYVNDMHIFANVPDAVRKNPSAPLKSVFNTIAKAFGL